VGLLAGSGPIDPVAVYIAISGGPRRVELTRDERMIAAAFILAAGGQQSHVAARLGISRAEACRVHARIKAAVQLCKVA
jgi:hypothetical protein